MALTQVRFYLTTEAKQLLVKRAADILEKYSVLGSAVAVLAGAAKISPKAFLKGVTEFTTAAVELPEDVEGLPVSVKAWPSYVLEHSTSEDGAVYANEYQALKDAVEAISALRDDIENDRVSLED